MPQMMPLNWMSMSIQLTAIILMLMILLFFLTVPTSPFQQIKSSTPPTSWKW